MCIGIPMQVIESDELRGRCWAHDGEHDIDMSLVGALLPGQWIMVFLGAAREIITEDIARATSDALIALEMTMRGETNIDYLFADLINREPELPEHLTNNRQTT